jgi:MFS family permease
MLQRLKRLHPFRTREAQRLALLFGVVYFSQGMWYLPNQVITIFFKDQGLSPSQVANFFLVSTIPWFIKPVYGLISDFVPLFGRRRKSYFLLTCILSALSGIWLAVMPEHPFWWMAALFTTMGFGLAFTDVLTDALMVEQGRPRGLTGAFQAVQWACITAAAVLIGVVGGHLAHTRELNLAFGISADFPLVSFAMALFFVHETPAPRDAAAFHATTRAIREALTHRDVWMVAGFLFFYTFSPSFGPAFLYYQTDVLGFSQHFIGLLASLNSAASVLGALVYAPLSRRMPLRRLLNGSIGVGVAGTLCYLVYRGRISAIAIDTFFGGVGMIMQLAFLDLAAKACPRRVEATFFALLMSVFNTGTQLSQNVGARLYETYGYTPLVWISATMTALAWVLVPLLDVDRIEAQARAAEAPTAPPAALSATDAPPAPPSA